jgi:hypothetical protein
VQPDCKNAPCQADIYSGGLQFLCGALGKLRDYSRGCLLPIEFVGERIEAERGDLFKFFLSLDKLIAGLKFQAAFLSS